MGKTSRSLPWPTYQEAGLEGSAQVGVQHVGLQPWLSVGVVGPLVVALLARMSRTKGPSPMVSLRFIHMALQPLPFPVTTMTRH